MTSIQEFTLFKDKLSAHANHSPLNEQFGEVSLVWIIISHKHHLKKLSLRFVECFNVRYVIDLLIRYLFNIMELQICIDKPENCVLQLMKKYSINFSDTAPWSPGLELKLKFQH